MSTNLNNLVSLPCRRSVDGRCPFCQRDLPLTFHHLIPRKLHRRPRFKRRYSREQLMSGIYICRDCHSGIHRAYSEMELGQHLATPDALAADEALGRHFAWLARQQRRKR